MTRTMDRWMDGWMDGWMVGECDRGGPQLWPPGAGGWWEGREREMAILISIMLPGGIYH